MANVFDSHVWTLDTTGAIWSYTTQGPLKIKKLVWLPSAASQTLLISETDGGRIWGATSLDATPVGDQELSFHGKEEGWFDGFTLTTLTSGGKLYVYLA